MRIIVVPIVICYLTLAGCASTGTIGSIAGGECKLTRTSQYAVLGKTKYDQAWVNRTTEALVRGCRQPRPGERPPELDAQQIGMAKQVAQNMTPKQKSRLRRWLGL